MRLLVLLALVVVVLGMDRHYKVPRGQEMLTDEWVIKLTAGINPEKFAEDNGLTYKGSMRLMPDHHLFVGPMPSESRSRSLHQKFSDNEHVQFFQQQKLRQQIKRDFEPLMDAPRYETEQKKMSDIKPSLKRSYNTTNSSPYLRKSTDPIDPFYAQQWTLHGPLGSKVHVNAPKGWAQGATGKGIILAVVDDGCNHNNPDLSPNFDQEYSANLNEVHTDDPSPWTTDGHGTGAAGVCCAAQNNVCVSGVAPEVTLGCIKLIARPTSDADEAQALSVNNKIRIYSNSWGPADEGHSLSGPGYLTKQTIRIMTTQHNAIYVWAAGNGRERKDNVNYDGYANSIYTIAVSAHNHEGKASWYAEEGACIAVSAPSSGAGMAVSTTDLQDIFGASNGNCRNDFGGTSAAAPLVAGLVADLLSKYPNFDYRQVMHVLASSARKIDLERWDWTENKRGYHHSHAYGWGHPDLNAMLEAAPQWTQLPRQHELYHDFHFRSGNIPRAMASGKEYLVDADASTTLTLQAMISSEKMDFVEHVAVTVELQHHNIGSVRISLVSPEGKVSFLALQRDDRHSATPDNGWTFTTTRHWGEKAHGHWKVLFDDVGSGARGKVKAASLMITGFYSSEETHQEQEAQEDTSA